MTLQELYEILGKMIKNGMYPGNKIQIWHGSDESGSGDFYEADSVYLAIDGETKKRVLRIT